MVRELSLQKVAKQFNSPYNSCGEGASKTKSSAYANKNSYKDAIVYASRFKGLVP